MKDKIGKIKEDIMKKPVIGIVAKNQTVIDEDGTWLFQKTNSHIRYELLEQGAIVIGILPTNKTLKFSTSDDGLGGTPLTLAEKRDLIAQLKLVDGIILQGGPYSDPYEEFIAKYCWDHDIPLIGICAGFNNIVRGLGGSTYNQINKKTHLRKNTVKDAHDITIKKDSLLYALVKKETLAVNSIHSWAGKELKLVKPTAFAPDGVIEAVEGAGKTFYIGLKFHPELLYNDNNAFKNIFKVFVKRIREKIS